MNIPIHLLQTLTAFSQAQTLQKAAEMLLTTQPTVTRQLQQLQNYLPHPLFEETSHQKKMTTYGQQLVHLLKNRFESLDLLIHNLNLQEGLNSQSQLIIAGRSEILRRHFALIEHPARIILEPMTSHEIEKALRTGSVDMAITQDEILTRNYTRKLLFSDKLCLIVPKKIKKLNDWLEQYKKYSFATYKKDFSEIHQTLKRHSFYNINESFIFPDWQIIEDRAHRTLNWALIPSSFVKDNRNYSILDIPKGNSQNFYFYYKKTLRKVDGFEKIMQFIAKI